MIAVSIDIETTSLSPKSGVPIQLGAVIFNTQSEDFKILGGYSKVIGWDVLTGQPGALAMNAAIIKEMDILNSSARRLLMDSEHFRLNSFMRDDISPLEAAQLRKEKQEELAARTTELYSKYIESNRLTDDFIQFLKNNGGYYKDSNGKEHLNLCGKNIMQFDIPFLKETIEDFSSKIRYHYRTLDPCGLYFIPSDECPPNLELCMRRAKLITNHIPKYQKYKELFETTEVKHTGFEDAEYVAKLIWFYYKLESPVWLLLTECVDSRGTQTAT